MANYPVPDPHSQSKRIEFELRKHYPQPQHDPEKPPPKDLGDGYIILFMFIGLIAGAILGVFLSFRISLLSLILGLIVSAVDGGIIGTLFGKAVKSFTLLHISINPNLP